MIPYNNTWNTSTGILEELTRKRLSNCSDLKKGQCSFSPHNKVSRHINTKKFWNLRKGWLVKGIKIFQLLAILMHQWLSVA